MHLRRELLRAQSERGDHLLGALPVLQVAEAEEHDLPDQGVVRHHHGHRPEQSLEVVGKGGTPGIPRVHGDEDGEVWVYEDVRLPVVERGLGGVGNSNIVAGGEGATSEVEAVAWFLQEAGASKNLGKYSATFLIV